MDWDYSDRLTNARKQRLLTARPYAALLAALVESARIVEYRREEARSPHLRGTKRAHFVLSVKTELYDQFFNGPTGYRAQYALSTEAGEKANLMAIEALTPILEQYLARVVPDEQEWAMSSLALTQSKVWIAESEPSARLALSADDGVLMFHRWRTHAPDKRGITAPIGRILEVKGGWMAPYGTEVIDPCKSCRAVNIHRFGYA